MTTNDGRGTMFSGMTTTTRVLIAIVLWTAVVLLIADARVADAHVRNTTHVVTTRNTCNAPCVVSFGRNMHEDEFCIDYRGNGTLRVWRQHNDGC